MNIPMVDGALAAREHIASAAFSGNWLYALIGLGIALSAWRVSSR